MVNKEQIINIINFYDNFINQYLSCSIFSKDYKEIIRTNIKKIVEKETLSYLSSLQIDELQEVKKSKDIALLKNDGFITALDLYQYNDYYELKYDNIRAIQKEVHKLARDYSIDKKIKISSDNKDIETYDLLLSIYQYKNIQTPFNFLNQDDIAKEIEKIEEAIQELKSIAKNNKSFLFLSNRLKTKIKNNYNYLSNFKTSQTYYVILMSISTVENIENDISDELIWNDFEKHSIDYFTIIEEICPQHIGSNNDAYGLPEDLINKIKDEDIFPNGLLCNLRRYQEWGVKYILHQGKVLLGDEMGLGKTIQAIATMTSLKNVGATHFLVVCPASVLMNWCREIEEKSKLSVIKIHGSSKFNELEEWKRSGGVAVTTYETTSIFYFQDDDKIDLLVVDEAHYVKNNKAKRTQNIKRISQSSKRLLFMTGTALENRVDEMIALIKILNNDIAEKLEDLSDKPYAKPFRDMAANVYYRRRRDDVLSEIPELIESEEWLSMNDYEEEAYEETLMSGNYMQSRRLSWNVQDKEQCSKLQRLKEIVEEAGEDERKIIVFSYFLDTINIIKNTLGNKCIGPLTGATSPQKRLKLIDDFDKSPNGTVLLSQIEAGGVGLNIQSASVVIICEPQLKPSTEMQAISRAYRMGQTHNVLVYRLLCENSLDERIMKMLENKQNIFDTYADKSTAAEKVSEIDDKSFNNLIQEEIDRIKQKSNKKGGN